MPEAKRLSESSSAALVELVDEVLADMKAEKIVKFPVQHLTSITDYMVIASGRSDRHVKAIASEVRERCAAAGCRALGVEGEDAGEWILVDLGDVVVHVMLPRTREFYNLEKLWDMSPDGEALPRG